MKIQFDNNQDFQLEAIKATIDLFEGQPLSSSSLEINLTNNSSSILTEKGISNQLILSDEQILENLKRVQAEFNKGKPEYRQIPISEKLEGMNFSIEMETGTGKTYTYIRTIYELNKTYGFKKFVIVVPSVSIREGVFTSLKLTTEHFKSLYDNRPCDFYIYNSSKLSKLANFASSNSIQILIINTASFDAENKIINQENERGINPIEYIKSTNPIVIVDEPQNMETDNRIQAISNLNPLLTLRYSATHTNYYNQIYKLDPITAFDLGLVKQIEVDSVVSNDNYNAAYIDFKEVKTNKKSINARLEVYVNDKGEPKKKTITVNINSDLYDLTNKREVYRGFVVNNIKSDSITFSNGHAIYVGARQGGLTDEILKVQIERTIQEHLKKEQKLNPRGIKVLSVFFIDRVENYKQFDSEDSKGKFYKWFEEIYERETGESPKGVHNGYFAKDKGQLKDTNGTTKADNEAYKLIMQEKERLLRLDTPLRFIFSHSALKEGWDNPNVFQICTLNETVSTLKKRQEIGRGLRLPVDSNGMRIFDKSINRLTVVANESYEVFARTLQKEYEDGKVKFRKDLVKNARDKKKVSITKDLSYLQEFKKLWDKIKQKTTYSVQYDTNELVLQSIQAMKGMPSINKPVITSTRGQLKVTSEGIIGALVEMNSHDIESEYTVPDVFEYVRKRTGVSRSTVSKIIQGSDRSKDLKVNPQLFLDYLVNSIKSSKNKLLVDGVKYHVINGGHYEMQLFENEEIERYVSELFEVGKDKNEEYKNKSLEKTIYDYIPVDSDVERDFAKDCENDSRVKFYFKLPRGFKIPTPLGHAYNPDWAVIFEKDKKIYFVAETKSTLDKDQLRGIENLKIACGEKHFAVIEGVKFKKVTKLSELI